MPVDLSAFDYYLFASLAVVGSPLGAWFLIWLSQHSRLTVMGSLELSNKVFGYAERNVASAFEFAQRMVQVRDFQSLITLQVEFIQAQMQAMTEQTKELSETATKALMDSVKTPTKGGPSS